MVSVIPHLWFGDDQAEEAARFYAAHLPGSSVDRVRVARDGPDSTVAEVVEFTVVGQKVIGLNAGSQQHLDEAFSFYLRVDGQEELDLFWDLLTSGGGEPGPCGWCKDRYGVSWQVVPRELEEMCDDYSTAANQRAFRAMLGMGKIDIAALRTAYDDA